MKNNRIITYWIVIIVLNFIFSCGENSTNKTTETDQSDNIPNSKNYLLGADISSLTEMVDNGAVFIDTDDKEKNLMVLLKNHGFNAIRLRTFVNPNAKYGYASDEGVWCEGKSAPYNDKEHILQFAKEVKLNGMKLLLDFHYSDTWADPNKQVIPEEWRNSSTIEDLVNYVNSYTFDVMNSLKEIDVIPDIVQIGNEITPGMLIHVPTSETDCYGNNSIQNIEINGSVDNWENLSKLLKAGINGVKQVDENIKIMLHLENTEDKIGIINWVTKIQSYGVSFDVLGLSAYEKWQGPSSNWNETFTILTSEFPDLEFSIVEYNPQRRLVNDIIYNLPNSKGLGTFFWEPVLSGEWGNSMFTQQGNVYTANKVDFAEFDQIKTDYGL